MIHREDGFSLVEVMIGSLLSGLLLAALVGIFQTGYTSLRVSSDAYLGQDDVQLALRYLMPDVQGTTRAHITVTQAVIPGDRLTVGVPDPVNDRFATITYLYDDTAGTITRTTTWAGIVSPEQVVVARHLKPGAGTKFTYCASGACPVIGGTGPKLRATLVFDINGTTVTREVDLAPKPTL